MDSRLVAASVCMSRSVINMMLSRSVTVVVSLFVVFAASVAEAGYNQSSYYSQPSYYSQSSYGAAIQSSFSAGKDFTVLGHVSKGSGTFVIDHPLDPKNKLLYHSTLDAKGEAQIELPHYFDVLNKDFRYQLKPIGISMPNLYVKEKITGTHFVVGGGVAGRRISWQVTGIRKDPYIIANPIEVEVEKAPGELVERGEFVHEGAYPSRLPSMRSFISRIGTLIGW
jgi:hypothetical protein